MEWLNSLGSSLGSMSNWLGSDAGKGATSLAGFGLDAYGTYKQNSLLEDQNALAKDAYNFNKSLAQLNLDKQKQRDDSFKSVWG